LLGEVVEYQIHDEQVSEVKTAEVKIKKNLAFQSFTLQVLHKQYGITGSAVTLHCGKAHVQSQWEGEGRTLTPMISKSLNFF